MPIIARRDTRRELDEFFAVLLFKPGSESKSCSEIVVRGEDGENLSLFVRPADQARAYELFISLVRSGAVQLPKLPESDSGLECSDESLACSETLTCSEGA